MGLVTIDMTCATCCAGSGDSAGAGGKESASATKWRSLGTVLAYELDNLPFQNQQWGLNQMSFSRVGTEL